MKKTIIILGLTFISFSAKSQYDINGDYKISGKLGIGTSIPQARLHIQDGGLRHGGTGEINIDAPSILGGRLKILNNGNIGVGITNPEMKFNINGGLRIATSEHLLYHLDIVPNIISSGNVRYDFIVSDYNDRVDEIMMSLNGQSGMIGIGTDQPQARLHIVDGGFRHGGTGEINIDAPSILGGRLKILDNGNVGIGTTTPDYKLDVLGTIRAREIKVDLNGADFVFETDYKLRTLEEVENFINENKHLPEIEPASEMEENGTDLGELNTKLLQKIEELTLYMIEMNKRMSLMETENLELKEKLVKLESIQ